MGGKRRRFQGQYKGLTLALFLYLALNATPVAAATLEVSPDGPIQTISQALDLAVPGDRVNVHPGVYTEGIVIRKSVELVGIDYPKINGGGNGDTVTIKADGVTVKGFEITGSGRKLESSDAGIKLFSSHNVVQDNRLMDNLFGIYLNKASANLIQGNQISGRAAANRHKVEDSPVAGLHPTFEGDGGDGIHLFAAPGNKVLNNTIKNTRDGIYFNYADSNYLLGNRISNVRYGIHYMYSNDNTFESNILTDNVAGAALMFSKRITFKNNTFAHSRGQRSYGLLFSTCDNSFAEGNMILDNTRGAFFDVSLHNVFRNNVVAANDVGIDLISSSSDNLFVGNNLIDNLQQVAMIAGQVGEGNVFFKDGQGNYWNDYRGFDLDRDGKGDVPYVSGDPFTYLMKKAPAVRLFLNSPAATALEFSERMFPILNLPKVKDQYPLMEPIPLQTPGFSEFSAAGSSSKLLGLYSIGMLVAAGLVFRRVFRLSSNDRKRVRFRRQKDDCGV